jgi:hypothetical protein
MAVHSRTGPTPQSATKAGALAGQRRLRGSYATTGDISGVHFKTATPRRHGLSLQRAAELATATPWLDASFGLAAGPVVGTASS